MQYARRLDNERPFKLYLSSIFFLSTNSFQSLDPGASLLKNFHELCQMINSQLINKGLLTDYFNYIKKSLFNILFDNEEKIGIKPTFEKRNTLPYLYYLSILIEENTDIVYFYYNINFIKEIYTITKSTINSFEKIILSKILTILIRNYLNDENESEADNINNNELKSITDDIGDIYLKNINIFNNLDLKLNEETINILTLDELYTEIVISITRSDFTSLDFIENICIHIGIKDIKITYYMSKKVEEQINKNDHLIEKSIDFTNVKKINFYYFLLKYIYKDSKYIYQIPFLLSAKKVLTKAMKDDLYNMLNNFENKDIQKRFIFIVKKLFDSNFYIYKYLKIELNLLNTILDYYKKFFFESKKNEIIAIQEILKNQFGDYEPFLKDLEIAENKNLRYEIINYLSSKWFQDINEEKFTTSVRRWELIEYLINYKIYDRINDEDRNSIFQYIIEKKGHNYFEKIFEKDIYNNFLNNIFEEILNYYKNYCFESKKEDINNLENYIRDKSNFLDYNKYRTELGIAKQMNDRYKIINYIYNIKDIKEERELKKAIGYWKSLEKMIKEKKYVRIQKKRKLLTFFKDKKNKEYILKFFKQDIYEFFLDKYNEFIINDLKPIQQYYKNYFSESKKEEIKIIEEILNSKKGNFDEYLQDFEQAQKMNDRYPIIKYFIKELKSNEDINPQALGEEQERNPPDEKTMLKFSKYLNDIEEYTKNNKIKKIKKIYIEILYKYCKEENEDDLLNIFDKETLDKLFDEIKNKGEKKDEIDENLQLEMNLKKQLREVQKYFQNYLFDSKKEDIKQIDKIINNNSSRNEEKEKYLKYYDTAVSMNNKYDLFDHWFKGRNIRKNENEVTKALKVFDEIVKCINDKKIKKKLNKSAKTIIYEYFKEEKHKNSLLNIFNLEAYEFFLKENEGLNVKEEKKVDKDMENKLKQLNEILLYYKRYLFESKKETIKSIEDIINNKVGKVDEYLNDYETALKMNNKYELFDYWLKKKNNNRTENDIKKALESFDEIVKCINDKKIKKKLSKSAKSIFLEYIKNINNKESLLKIFSSDSMEFFIKDCEESKGKQEEKKEEIKEDKKEDKKEEKKIDISKLNEILIYYKRYLFESKKEQIKQIEELINKKEGNDEQYIKDFDMAVSMNNKYEFFNFWLNYKNIRRTENEIAKAMRQFDEVVKCINDKKIKNKLNKTVKNSIYEYFKDNNNKESVLKIISQDSYEYFIKENEVSNEKKIDIPKLNEILNYYKRYLFESKQEQIKQIEELIAKNSGNDEQYLKDYEIALSMNNKYELFNLCYNKKNRRKTENDIAKDIKSFNEVVKCINAKKNNKLNKTIKNRIYEYFKDKNNKESLLKIFEQDSYECFINENESPNEKKIDMTKLNEILIYYKRYVFESKKEQIKLIEEIINKKEGNDEQYIKDYDLAVSMNKKYEFFNFWLNKKNIRRTEKEIAKAMKQFDDVVKCIKDKKTNRLNKVSKNIVYEYFKDNNNKESLLKIIDQESYEFFINENKDSNRGKINITKLNEILIYYKRYLFESKKEQIKQIEEIINKNSGNDEQYIKDYDMAVSMNNKYEFFNFWLNKKNIRRTENDIAKSLTSFDDVVKCIKDQKLNRLNKTIKNSIYEYFKDKNNKESLLKIFNQDSYEYFIKENEGSSGKKIDITKLNEILTYYRRYLFESKKEQIKQIEELMKKKEGNDEQYIKDYDMAVNMNNKYELFNFWLDKKNIIRTENEITKTIKQFDDIIKCINDKKIKNKLSKGIKNILYEYFKDKNNKESLLKIFRLDSYEYFIKENEVSNEKNIDIVKLNEILNYYKRYLFE